ncbi:ABC-type amino acid ABC transporter, permease protein [Maize bushy stunt phytoplasma]|uniref:ABC-type amino acid ABC transporter, permease protein n=1 Tax=Maize bushy stunt phytoplasma TaxID=202462 RepID=A0ABN4RYH8_9MOLU|nr:ABC-type amino acid ABC transporter, permease protein [Maize bushy stunt phytoplasma]
MNNFINLINKNSFLKNIFQKKNNIKIFKIITLSISSILLVWLHFSVFGWHFSTKTKKQNLQKYSKTLKVAKTVFDNHKDMLSKSTTWHQIKETFPSYLEGLKTTLILAIDGLIIGFLFATSYTLIKNSQSHNKIILNINKGTTYFLDTLFFILKGIPVAAQAMLVFYGIGYLCKDLFEIKRLYAGLFVLVLNSLANITVILMQNIKFLDKGQIEAAHSLGMNQKQVFFSIIFPQALKRSVPFIIQQFITNIKDSSFFAIIGIAELSWQAQSNMGSTFNPILPFVTISCFYLIIISITNLLNKIFTKNILHK